jgi:DNA-directed RNA polymerase sigma subunit (sigma70/sigma32)
MIKHTQKEILEKYENLKDSAKLTSREMQIFELRYGITDDIFHTLDEIARGFDLSRERIRQIEAKVIWKLGLDD